MRFSGVALAAGLQLPSVLARGGNQKPLFDDELSGSWAHTKEKGASKPNIVFVLTDDQDLHMNSLDYLPLIKKHLIDQGTLYKRHYCTTAICCPARVSLWTGKQAHNTNVTDVNPPHGGYPKFVKQGLNNNYLPVWLQEAGYNTYYAGKLFNAHTTENWNNPRPNAWTASDFLLDPYTYDYLNATYQRNNDPPVSYEGQHTVDVLAKKSLGFLDDAVDAGKPFFLGIAPVAPHSNVKSSTLGLDDPNWDDDLIDLPDLEDLVSFTAPIPAERHKHLFKDVKIPRTPNFNPDFPTGANWVRTRQKLSKENIEYNDEFYRQRLRALQSVDELVASVVARLKEHGVLDNTYIFYTTDNGYHISQHRLNPGKECGFEEDINIPLIIRGPGVSQGEISEIVTTHTDLAPTILSVAGIQARADFDGEAIPLNQNDLEVAVSTRHEHVTVEFWGFAVSEGKIFDKHEPRLYLNNTYKAIRIVSKSYNFYYAVWCDNEHELYDLTTDPYQINNLLHESAKPPATLLGVPFNKVISRLDALLFVLKSCKGQTCIRPWQALHPAGNVLNLHDALGARFDVFYEQQQKKVSFNRCELGYIVDAEGPQFETEGLVYRHGVRWSEWT
ncbi:alkaline-phosphatase-like protein [Podospora australis]|uniref:Arylsulfatase n=1 Tax=Podospora australis TaxID=1536484 RepID=A0AAN6WQU0_9PEZI|nr:alkaline-phosphatase-like protein [Podospora australis]